MAIDIALLVLIFFIAIMYSMVGHGGASGYIAALVLFSFPLADIRLYALLLNILVSGIAFYSFYKAGYFEFRLLCPFILTSIPLAFWGGSITIKNSFFHVFIAISLLISAVQMVFKWREDKNMELRKVPIVKALPVGAGIGFASGLLGIGGGILLSPLLILFRWADAKTTASVSAAFIFLNSVSGLTAQLSIGNHIAPDFGAYAATALFGGLLGSGIGSNRLSVNHLKIALSVLLVLASAKLLIPS